MTLNNCYVVGNYLLEQEPGQQGGRGGWEGEGVARSDGMGKRMEAVVWEGEEIGVKGWEKREGKGRHGGNDVREGKGRWEGKVLEGRG